ncbi:MAG: murein biosynthesis integral membrane protein MurJ [Synergistaceae bacterium]|nr:murein biosynthesis integral membrane protein MurJ [Synergistota bacterium]NLM71777.1 murein biosynthesis integral membrane protein MurJ [Synergistaceae bacterium]
MVRHALTMMLGTLASRVLGLVREIVTAAWFGASGALDAFNVSFTLANLARQLLAEGALSASFVPVFSRTLASKGRESAARLARQALSVLLAVTIVAVVAGVILSPLLVKIMAPGFDPVKAELAVSMTRWMFPFLLFVSLAALAMGVLNSMGSFMIPALAPALSNLVYIVIVAFAPIFYGVWGLVVAVLAGGACQFVLQWFWSARKGVVLTPMRPDLDDPDLGRMLALFLPYAAGLSLNQVNPVISRMLASFLEEGSISVLNYANRVIQLPLGIFVIAISQAVLPQLSKCPTDDPSEFRGIMRDSLRFTLFVVFPATLGLVMASSEIVHLLFVRGAFGEWAWRGTAHSLSMYSLGLPGMALSTVAMRGLYARSMPRAAMIVTLTSVAGTLAFSLALMRPMSFGGLALATSLAFTLSGWAGIRMLSSATGGSFGVFSLSWSGRMLLSLSVTAVLVLLWRRVFPYSPAFAGGARAAWVGGLFCFAALGYSVATVALRFQEWRWLFAAAGVKRDGRDR